MSDMAGLGYSMDGHEGVKTWFKLVDYWEPELLWNVCDMTQGFFCDDSSCRVLNKFNVH